MKKLFSFISGFALAAILGSTVSAQTTSATVEKLWSKTTTELGATVNDTRQGIGRDGVVYLLNKANQSLVAVSAEGQDTLCVGPLDVAEGVTASLDGTACTLDDAGNFVIEGTFPNIPSHLVLRKADGSIVKDFAIKGLARTDYITATGDVFSAEGGHVFLYGNNANLLIYKVAEGVLVGDPIEVVGVTNGNNNNVISGDDKTQIIHHRTSQAGWMQVENGSESLIEGMEGFKNTTMGGDIITLAGKEFYIYPTGTTNYNSEFCVRNMTDGVFVVDKADGSTTSFTPNSTEAVSSTIAACWLSASKIDDNNAYIHVFNSQGVAVYKLSVSTPVDTPSDSYVIKYTSSDGNIVTPNASDVFGANIVSNTYSNGQGVITFDGPVTYIGPDAFFYCSSLTSITIPKSVTSIGNSAFLGCSSLNAIYITDIAAWCNISFGNNEANPLYDAHNLYLNGKLVTDLVIPNSVTSIRDWAFSYCSSLRSITIPNSVTSIGEHAFYECFSLTSITIPNSVTSIGSSAFSYCSSLTSITIPNSVTSIGDNAFYECSSLTSVAIGNSVTSIGNVAFSNCSSLTSVTIPNSVTTIGYRAFEYCSSLTSITIPNRVTSIGEGAFAWCTKLGSVYVKCLTPPTIAADAFYNTSPICYIPCGALSAYKTSNWSSQVSKFIEECEENTITYTTSDGNIVTPYASDVFGVNIVSNTYSNGQGVITFDGPVTSIGDNAFYECSSLTSITIPNSVTTIGYRAFYKCSSLTSITIPNSVTSIGRGAFSDCSSLTSITIPNSVTSIGNSAFLGCSSLTSITIPNSVTSIGWYAFRGCSSLTSITIPNSVTSIGEYAFEDCSSITSMTVENGNTVYDSREKCNAIIETATNTLIVGCQNTTIPNNVTSIGDYAFRGCSSLTSITIPNSVTSIGEHAFSYCSSLTSITIPNSVKRIEEYTFSGCSSLTSVTIPNSVTSIGDWAFYGTGIYNDESNWENKVLYIDDCLIEARASISGAYTINENARLIANRAFEYCSSLTSITIPNRVTSIGEGAFSDCSSLTSVTIGNSVTSIGEYAFYKCSSLTSITIPNSVTNIGESAFAWCTKLGSVYVKCLTPPTIAADAFYNTSPICCIPCGTLSTYKTSNWSSQLSKFIEECEENTITYTSSNGNIVTPYASDVFGANIVSNTYSNGQGVITFDGPVTSIGDRAFYNCSSLTSITIPNSVTSIGEYAFYSYVGSSLTSITIPNSVTSIGACAFGDCSSLTSITIPNSVKSIKDFTFSGCSRLTSIVIPNSVTSIGFRAFLDCSSLTSITIPNSVTSIGDWAFYDCSSLSDITLTAHSIEEFCRGKVNFLLTDNGVSNAARHLQINDIEITELTISESVTSVGDYAFYNCSSLTSVTIPNSVTSIGSHAFYGCSSLTSATIPESVSSIGEGATFQKCTELKHVYWNATNCTIEQNSNGNYYPPFSSLNNLEEFKFGDNVTNIPIYLCYKLAGLKAIVIPNSVTSIGTGAFSGCSSLTSVTIPNSVTSIGKYAFQDCSSLTSVTIPNSVTSIGTYVFQNCSSLISANIGNNVTNVRDYTFSGCSSLTSVTIPNSVTSIGKYAFQDCSSLTSVTIPNSVTSVESSAFNDCKALNKITLPASIRSIGPNAFAGCTKLYDIYCFAMEPPTAYESSFANYNAFLHVPCDNQRVYLLDVLFGNFKYIECIEAETTPTDTVVVTPSFNDAEFIWPSNSSADSYTLAISKDGEVFCTLTFNANGQLTGIAFAPSRNGQHNAPAAAQTANGFAFTVTGLDEGSNYTYELLIQDRSGNTLQSYYGEFRTQSTNDRTVTVEYNAAQGQVTGAGTYLVGDTVTLTAIPNDGYRFVRWSNEVEDNPYTFVITENITLSAEFEKVIATSIEHTHSQSPMTDCQKIIHNGQLLILRDGVEYNAQGQIIKE